MTDLFPTVDPEVLKRLSAPQQPTQPAQPPVANGAPAAPANQPTSTKADARAIPMPAMSAPSESMPVAKSLSSPGSSVFTPEDKTVQDHKAELARLTTGKTAKSGIGQLPLAAKIPLSILDAIGGGFFPRVSMLIPGTQLHHEMLTRNAASDVNHDVAQQKEATGSMLQEAQARHANAQAETLENPNEKANKEFQEIPGGAVDPDNPTKGTQVAFYNKNTGDIKFGNAAPGAKPEKEGGSVHEDAQGNMWVIHQDGSATAVSPKGGGSQIKGKSPAEAKGTVHEDAQGNMWVVKDDGSAVPVTPKGAQATAPPAGTSTALPTGTLPAPTQLKGKLPNANDTEIINKMVNGKPHNVMIKKSTGEIVQDLGEHGEKATSENAGTWQIQEDADGKPVLFNSKTAQTKPISGVQKPGTAAKAAGPHDALNYANQYLAGGNHTGAGDEALLEKFFELAKPSSGFRMTQSQQDMLMHTRDLVQGLTAKAKHAFTPNAPYFDDTQRKNIVDTMNQLAAAKGIKTDGGAGGGVPKIGETFNGHKVLKVEKIP